MTIYLSLFPLSSHQSTLYYSGSGSVAAVNACGLNQEEAISHLSAALSLEQTWDLRRVREAASFCVQEHAEVEQWSSIANEIREKSTDSNSVNSAAAVESVTHTSGLNSVFAPIRLLRSATHYLFRQLFTVVGICNQNLLEKKDFIGFLGFVTRFLKSTCTAPSKSKRALTGANAALSSPEELMMKVRVAMMEL